MNRSEWLGGRDNYHHWLQGDYVLLLGNLQRLCVAKGYPIRAKRISNMLTVAIDIEWKLGQDD